MSDTRAELNRVIPRIALFSQVAAANLGQSARRTDEDIGGRRPTGGIDRQDDREPDYLLKSAEYFRRKLARCRTDAHYEVLLAEANRVIAAWMWTPAYDGPEPLVPKSFRWKVAIAEDTRDMDTIKSVYTVSERSVYRYREQYRGLRRNPSDRAVS